MPSTSWLYLQDVCMDVKVRPGPFSQEMPGFFISIMSSKKDKQMHFLLIVSNILLLSPHCLLRAKSQQAAEAFVFAKPPAHGTAAPHDNKPSA